VAKIALYNQQGEKKGEVEVSDTIFGAKVNEDLIHQALVRQHANSRVSAITFTKTKSEVSGGGRKPYRQKGTGKARQGSIRNPHWKGGGVAFGPKNNRNYKQMMPKKQRRLALFSALSLKLKDSKIIALDKLDLPGIKTKAIAQVLEKLPGEKDTLVLLPETDNKIQKSTRNLPSVKTMLVNYLNIADLQRYDQIIFLEEALKKLEKTFLGNVTAKKAGSSKS
jgi:large subunit ribosomal protein L4